MIERLGDDVARELRRFGPQGAMADVVGAWPVAVGEAIARNAWPARIARDGTLHVSTSSSAWSFELAQLAPELLARLGATLHESAPKALKFSPGPLPEAPAQGGGTAPDPLPDPTPEERALASAISSEIEDEELRKLVARAAAASLAQQRSDRSVW
ncbi:MAG: DUF721 domain-containing protein [Thermoleophilia bacterium]|nr:DUF721 domain-containing protein [Thermoleophilia bacterium]